MYDHLHKLTDLRKVQGKRYSLVSVLMITILAKLCGANTPTEIAERGENHREELIQLLKLKRASMPEQSTYRRIMVHKVNMEEVERLVGEYNQQGRHGDIYAMDGKALRGMRKKNETGLEYLLSMYDVEQGKTLSQVEVGCKENEIKKASQALELVEISQKVITGDALLTQKRISRQILDSQGDFVFPSKRTKPHCTKIFKNSLHRSIPNRVLEKSRLIFSPLTK